MHRDNRARARSNRSGDLLRVDCDRIRTRGDTDGVRHPTPGRELALELLDRAAPDEAPALEDRGDRRVELFADRRHLTAEVEERDARHDAQYKSPCLR